MKLPTIKQVLMERDGLTDAEATEAFEAFKSEFDSMLDCEATSLCDLEELLEEHFGLEPDYLLEVLPL